jgi:hypothetical protein
MIRAERFRNNPIICPEMLADSHEHSVNGPSLIRMPEWVRDRRGTYYLYFGHHRGRALRVAYADALEGPWRIDPRPVLSLCNSRLVDHIASPDVVVDNERWRILMYYHGLAPDRRGQWTRVATSPDGLHFEELSPIVADAYLRVFRWKGWYYGVSRPPVTPRLCRSRSGCHLFRVGPEILEPAVRHCAVGIRGKELWMFFSMRGDCPESILMTRWSLEEDWRAWRPCPPQRVLEPELDYEGADCPLAPSLPGPVRGRVRELRDPGLLFDRDSSVYLAYTVAGESGIAIARLIEE